jgi:hypothetical protein
MVIRKKESFECFKNNGYEDETHKKLDIKSKEQKRTNKKANNKANT